MLSRSGLRLRLRRRPRADWRLLANIMATLLDFRRRIRSVKSSQQITRAMKFVAAARLRRAQEAALAARPYAQELARVLRSTMARSQEPQHPLLERREEKNVLAIVLAGERGLAGAFNTNIL